MDRVFFENVRCFSSRQVATLAPLTILVGENSSGKSTFLGLVRLAWDVISSYRTPDFNEEPFLLGAYDQLSFLGSDSEEPVVLGAEFFQETGEVFRVTAKFEARRGQPALSEILLDLPPYRVSALFEREDWITDLIVEGPSVRIDSGALLHRGVRSLSMALQLTVRDRETLNLLEAGLLDLQERLKERPYAFAPIRTRPLRTYDPIQGLESPEGSHIPTILASTLLSEPGEWTMLADALAEFGRSSGLFSRVEVRRLGSGESDPFQIRVHIGGKAINLIDVGYGVSQIIPIVVDSLRGHRGGTFLLQQPEVHLHPRAQAELGSFLGMLAKQQDKRFVVETHSDHLLDRIRMDVRDRKNGLEPDDVSLLYFDRSSGEGRIHQLELDARGNLMNVPVGYRSFFLNEERRFLRG
ncbi:MAG TPA: AAA family ATPase [Thermoanaerobaculia bacterium]|nr:AAA family ATPase [Thermoanaerobaculia bacterium]